jgi:hypothetical protein
VYGLANREWLDSLGLGHRAHQRRHPRAEACADLEERRVALLDHVVQEGGGHHLVGIAGVAQQSRDEEHVLQVGTSVRVLALPGMGARR